MGLKAAGFNTGCRHAAGARLVAPGFPRKSGLGHQVGDEKPYKPKPRTGLVDEVGPGLSGIAQLRALIASGRRPGILITLDLQLVEVELGKAVFAGTPSAAAYNP